MEKDKCINFNWDELLERIESKNIIPVIGQGLYWIENDHKERLLYDYLAEKLTEEIDITLPCDVNHKFSKAAFEYLRKNNDNYLALRKRLLNILKTVKPTPGNPLGKLARIKAFKLFINTTYDDLMANTIKTFRKYPTRTMYYTLKDKNLDKLDNELFDTLGKSECTLVYNIYGNLKERIDSALTEKDILETIVSFQKDMEVKVENRLFQELKGNSLLFIGCGYDDWLFRFFIRTMCNQPYKYPKDPICCKFVGDVFTNNKKDPFNELPGFLTNYDTEVFYSCNGKDFVDTLFEKLEQKYPNEIIPVSDFPETAFISFPGVNRPTALQLASQLRADGINVWVDENEFNPGDEIDETIINAIEKCPVFIPLISEESKIIRLENGEMKYHYQEWIWVYLFNKTRSKKLKTIVPVIIDGTDWMYEKFKELCYLKIPGGAGGEYDKLRKMLLKLQIERDSD
jgi:hypothetical protein